MTDTQWNFTERTRKVLSMARDEAVRFRHQTMSPEHIILGLIREGEGVAAAVLQNQGVSLEKVQREVEGIVSATETERTTAVDLPWSSRGKQVLEQARTEARQLDHHYIGTEHLLLALLRDAAGVPAQVFARHGLTIDNATTEISWLLGPDSERPKA